ncbi:MAG: hypothetical protein U1A07_25085 [Phenylobacterium sp.]|nr:hypothetical protein [Phenylobacterium sp.]
MHSSTLVSLAEMAARQSRLLKRDGAVQDARDLAVRALALLWLAKPQPVPIPVRNRLPSQRR